MEPMWGWSMWKFQASSKKEMEFLEVIKNTHVEFPWVLVFGCHWNFQGM